MLQPRVTAKYSLSHGFEKLDLCLGLKYPFIEVCHLVLTFEAVDSIETRNKAVTVCQSMLVFGEEWSNAVRIPVLQGFHLKVVERVADSH